MLRCKLQHYLFVGFCAASVEACRRNIKLNGSIASSEVVSKLADTGVYMLTDPKEFDVVCFILLTRVHLRQWRLNWGLCIASYVKTTCLWLGDLLLQIWGSLLLLWNVLILTLKSCRSFRILLNMSILAEIKHLLTFSNFFTDQHYVRLLPVEGCAAIGKLLEPHDCLALILPVIVNLSGHFQ